jgi:hypothetical protein
MFASGDDVGTSLRCIKTEEDMIFRKETFQNRLNHKRATLFPHPKTALYGLLLVQPNEYSPHPH